MKKIEYRDITGNEAYKLLTLGEEAESLESEDKWRRYKVKIVKSTLKDPKPSGRLMHYKKGEWRESPLELGEILNREWRTRSKPMAVSFGAVISKNPESGKSYFEPDDVLISLDEFPDGARVRVTVRELLE